MTRVILFGATGMIGQGVLRECLLDQGIASVITVGRRPIGKSDAKLNDVVLEDPAAIAKDTKLYSDLKQGAFMLASRSRLGASAACPAACVPRLCPRSHCQRFSPFLPITGLSGRLPVLPGHLLCGHERGGVHNRHQGYDAASA